MKFRLYEDEEGKLYQVMKYPVEKQGGGTRYSYKAMYSQNNGQGWHSCRHRSLPWADTAEKAERDLEAFAKEKHLMEVGKNDNVPG